MWKGENTAFVSLLFLLPWAASAQTFAVPWSTLSGGFGSPGSPQVRVLAALGQSISGIGQQGGLRVNSGFLGWTAAPGQATAVPPARETPLEYSLEQNFPNPFNPTTTIRYSVARKGLVNLIVFNLLGERMATLVNDEQEPGAYQLEFSAGHLSSGTYFLIMKTSDFFKVRKLLLVR